MNQLMEILYLEETRIFCKKTLSKKYPEIKLQVKKGKGNYGFPYITYSFKDYGNLEKAIKNQRDLKNIRQDIMDFEKEIFLRN